MLPLKAQELLKQLCQSASNDIFQTTDREYIKKNSYILSELHNKGYIKKTCDDNEFILRVDIYPKTHYAIDNNFQEFNDTSKVNVSGNNNVLNYGNINNSFNVDSLNESIQELKNSDEPEELKQIILNAYKEHNELLQQTIVDIKNETTRQSKLDILKSFIKNIKATVQDVKALLNMLLNYF